MMTQRMKLAKRQLLDLSKLKAFADEQINVT